MDAASGPSGLRRTVADVMTRTVVSVRASAPFKDVVRLMHDYRVSALPVVDDDDRLVGIVSEGDLILKEDPEFDDGAHLFESRQRRHDREKAAGIVAAELMTTPVVTVTPDAPLGDAARLMYRRGVKRLPVVDEEGTIHGILSRSDLLKVFLRADVDIGHEVREDVIRRTLWIDPDTVKVTVHDGVVRLEGQLERRSLISVLERLVGAVEGVVGVDAHLSFDADDMSPVAEIPIPWTAVGRR
jgi:CBS-domain-containing membrane protein